MLGGSTKGSTLDRKLCSGLEMNDPRIRQSIAVPLNRAGTGKEVVVIGPLRDPQALADALIAEAERQGLKVNVDLLDDGIAVRASGR